MEDGDEWLQPYHEISKKIILLHHFFSEKRMSHILKERQNSTSFFYIKDPEEVKNYNQDPTGHLPSLDMDTKLLRSPICTNDATNHQPCPSRSIIGLQTLESARDAREENSAVEFIDLVLPLAGTPPIASKCSTSDSVEENRPNIQIREDEGRRGQPNKRKPHRILTAAESPTATSSGWKRSRTRFVVASFNRPKPTERINNNSPASQKKGSTDLRETSPRKEEAPP